MIDAKATTRSTPWSFQYNAGGDINAGTWGLFSDSTFNRADGGFTLVGGGHAADFFFDDWYTNGTLHWVLANTPTGTGDPRSVGLGKYDMLTMNGSNGLITVPSNLVAGGTYYFSNTFTAAYVTNLLTNGSTWMGMLSNKLVAAYKTNGVVQWSNVISWQ